MADEVCCIVAKDRTSRAERLKVNQQATKATGEAAPAAEPQRLLVTPYWIRQQSPYTYDILSTVARSPSLSFAGPKKLQASVETRWYKRRENASGAG